MYVAMVFLGVANLVTLLGNAHLVVVTVVIPSATDAEVWAICLASAMLNKRKLHSQKAAITETYYLYLCLPEMYELSLSFGPVNLDYEAYRLYAPDLLEKMCYL